MQNNKEKFRKIKSKRTDKPVHEHRCLEVGNFVISTQISEITVIAEKNFLNPGGYQ